MNVGAAGGGGGIPIVAFGLNDGAGGGGGAFKLKLPLFIPGADGGGGGIPIPPGGIGGETNEGGGGGKALGAGGGGIGIFIKSLYIRSFPEACDGNKKTKSREESKGENGFYKKSQKQISNGSFSLTQSAGTICLKLIVFTQKHQCTYLHTFRQFPQKMVSIWNHLRF